MGSYIYLLGEKDSGIVEEKRQEFEKRLEKLFNESGMMVRESLRLFGKEIYTLKPVRIKNGYTTFYYNWFEDDAWENAGYSKDGVYSNKVGWREFSIVIEAAYTLQTMYMADPVYVFRNGELIVPWRFLGWFKYLFNEDYKLPDRDLMRLVEYLHEHDDFCTGILDKYYELVYSGYMIESVIDAVAVMHGTESSLKILGIDTNEKETDDSQCRYVDCIWKINKFIEEFRKNSSLDDEEQVQYLMNIIRKLAETDEITDKDDLNTLRLQTMIKLTSNYAFSVKKIAEVYNIDFWQLYKPFVGRERRSIFFEKWSEEQEGMIESISTIELFQECGDELTYFWDSDKKIEFSGENQKWFGDLKKQFDFHMEENKPIKNVINYIMDDLYFVDYNYQHIYVFADFLEETLDHIQDLRYQALWRIFHDMVHASDMLQMGESVFDSEALEKGEKCLKDSWTMTDEVQKRNKARKILRRYIGLVANAELRRKVFGF